MTVVGHRTRVTRGGASSGARRPVPDRPGTIVHVFDGGFTLTTTQLAELLDRAPTPPPVWLTLPEERVPAVLLAWGRAPGGWVAGVSYLTRTWHSRALVTMWAPASRVAPRPRVDYRHVPRVRLPPDPAAWPTLPPRYPMATGEWIAAHQHTEYPSSDPPAGRSSGSRR